MRATQSAGNAGLVAASEGSLVVSVSVVTLSSRVTGALGWYFASQRGLAAQ